jgi:competence protein ComEC
VGLVFIGNILYKYVTYKSFIQKSQFIEGKIVTQYRKKNYWILKIKSKNLLFYTTTKDDLKNILNRFVEVGVITKNISFLEYISTFYAPTFHLGILDIPQYKKFINNQHKDKNFSNIFNALFFGDSLYYETRQKLSTLGISHLFALSGLHLAIISGILYLLFTPIYNMVIPTYRNRNIDLGFLILITLFFYLYFVDFPASLVRSFVMEMIVFVFAYFLRDVFSFKLLFIAVLVSIAIFPNLIINLGFFLSVMGVFLIFLFFKYFKLNFINGFLILPIYLYIAMIPISHYFFGNFNYYQLFSPFVTILFSFWYPFEIILHILGIGGIFDEVVKNYLDLGEKFITFYTPTSIFYLYLSFLSFLAFKKGNYLIDKSK